MQGLQDNSVYIVYNFVYSITTEELALYNNNNNNNNNNICKTQSPSIDKKSSVKILSVLNIYMIYLNNMYDVKTIDLT